jgi:hypothetical protein
MIKTSIKNFRKVTESKLKKKYCVQEISDRKINIKLLITVKSVRVNTFDVLDNFVNSFQK